MWRVRISAQGWRTKGGAARTTASANAVAQPLQHVSQPLAHWRSVAPAAAAASRCALHTCTARAYGGDRYDAPSDNPYLQPQRAQAEAARPAAEPLLRERPSPSAAATASPALTGAELVAQQARDMDRATKAARAARMKARRAGTDWRARADSRERDRARVPLPAPPPIYFPAPFAALPVIPAASETLESALIRVDKVPKSPGFGKEVSRIRGQLAKYNFTARRQLEVAELELATKLQQRIDMFPQLRKRRRVPGAPRGALVAFDGAECAAAEAAELEETASHDPFAAQLHPYDHALVELSLERGGTQYTSLLNHCRNLVQKLRGAAKQGLKGLNHSRNMADSRAAHMAAIARMKTLWKTGDVPVATGDAPSAGAGAGAAGAGAGAGASQRSGADLVEELRALSKSLRHLPTLQFDRNLLDVKRHPASYLSVLPQGFFFLPEDQLTFETLRPYLPPSPEYTLGLVGAPNVGKSSLLSAMSSAKVEVRNFAFTTTALQVGHLVREEKESPSMLRPEAMTTGARRARPASNPYPQPTYTPAVPLTRVQLVDTPGILFRPDAMRKPVEMMTLSLCAHVQPLLLAFVLDPTGTGGSGVNVQRFLRRELRHRFSFHTAPHPRASDTDPRNHLAHDPLYANVAADAELQSLTRRMQTIPWLTLRSKTDVPRRARVPDEVLARAQGGAEKEVRLVEEELLAHNRAVLEEKDEELQEEDEEGEGEHASAEGTSSSTDLTLAPPAVQPRRDRAAWKLDSIRAHMRKYLLRGDDSGTYALGEEEEEAFGLAPKGNTRLLASSTAAAAAAATSASASASSAFSSAPHALPTPTLSVSAESGQGLAELAAHIWFEVDQRESLRLEKAYKEMKARILWIRGSHGDFNHHRQITPPAQSQQIETNSSPISIE